jgi:hypothetical protein
MHEDLNVSFAVVHVFNIVGPGSSASSIFDGDVVFFGPFVSIFSPFGVTFFNLWRGDLHADTVPMFVNDGMDLVVTSTTPQVGNDVGMESINGLLIGTCRLGNANFRH